ncbi:MAG: hypothetical protein ACK5AO_07600 [bacterium]
MTFLSKTDSTKLFRKKKDKIIAAKVQTRSRNRIIQRGTIFIFLNIDEIVIGGFIVFK